MLLTAQRRPRRTGGSSYALTAAAGTGGLPPARVAKLRSNLLGTEFTLSTQLRGSGGEQEVATVTYAYNVLGTRGPRVMCAAVPASTGDSMQGSSGGGAGGSSSGGPPAPPLAPGLLLQQLRCGNSAAAFARSAPCCCCCLTSTPACCAPQVGTRQRRGCARNAKPFPALE